MIRSAVGRFLVVAVLLGIVVVAVLLRADDEAGPCVVSHRARLPEVPEASGLAVSRRTPGIIWSHNDSGHDAVLYAFDLAGAPHGRVRVPIVTRDWEDVSSGRCPAGACLYIADIGDNRLARKSIRIYRVPEPAPADATTAPPESITATYADGPHNAESLFVIGETLFVVARDRDGALYRSTPVQPGGLDVRLERVGQLRLAPTTDAEASPDEASVVVRTSREAVIYRTADLLRGGDVPYGLRIPIEGLKEWQGEGVALGANGALFLASEGWRLSRAGTFLSLRCTLP